MENFLRENLDILKEIGSIGMGHASTSLSHMLNMKVTMTTPAVYIMTTAEAREYLGRHGQESLGVRLGLQGDAKGKILQIHSKKFALHVINYFFQGGLEEISELDEMSFSVLQEIGNITSGSYCNSLASMTGMFVDISIPTHCKNLCDDIGLTGENPAYSPDETIMFIKNNFYIGNEEVTSDFLFIPDETTIKMLLQKLKEYYRLA